MDSSAAYQTASQQHLPNDFAFHSRPPSASSSAQSSPYQYHQQPAYAASGEQPHAFPQQFGQQHTRVDDESATSLHISTAAIGRHEHEPEEQTAHPIRSNGQPELAGGHDEAELQDRMCPHQQSIIDAMTTGPGPHGGLTRPLTHQERELISHLDRLKFFLATAPSRWNTHGAGVASSSDPLALPVGHPSSAHPALNRFLLPNSEYVSCVLWGGLYHITGTDIVRALVFRFEAFGRPVRNMKKFEEGVFSDLRNLKPGIDACLEEPKSPFLDLLFKYQCIRTQKKQKVFYWFSVPHDRLFLDALERDLKREKMGLEPTTVVVGEPALSFTYDPKRSLYEQFSKAQGGVEGEGELEAAVRIANESVNGDAEGTSSSQSSDPDVSSSEEGQSSAAKQPVPKKVPAALHNSPFFSMFSLFEGSPTYKQRRKKVNKGTRRGTSVFGAMGASETYMDDYGQTQMTRGPEPLLDRYGNDTTRWSAAQMFMAQNRGDFTHSNPDLIASQKERQRRAMEVQFAASSGRQGRPPYASSLMGPGVAGRAASVQPMMAGPGIAGRAGSVQPMMQASMVGAQYSVASPAHQPLVQGNLVGSSPAGSPMPQMYQQLPPAQEHHPRPPAALRHSYPAANYSQHPRSSSQPFQSENFSYTDGWPSGPPAVPESSSLPHSKAFVCPLYSCGKVFKRMEHLKRHMLTHTLKRPFKCEICGKFFSRSDNLKQHLRTHMRGGNEIVMSTSESGGVDTDADSEEVDELDGDDGTYDGGLDYISTLSNLANVQMYEVEVEGQMREVQGGEEGLMMAAGGDHQAIPPTGTMDSTKNRQDAYYPEGTVAQVVQSSPEQGPFLMTDSPPGAQWASVRPQSSMSYVASPHMRISPSYSVPGGEFVTSISAPSHKATFDHSSLYPTDLDMGGPGPIRRHRSVTPSVSKYGDAIRRPFSATMSDHGGPAASRSYHPYAVAHAHSAESSPLAFNVPLGYTPSHLGGSASRSHSHSRSSSSSQLQDQMQQMLNLEQHVADPSVYTANEPPGHSYGVPYQSQSDSPMQYATTSESYELVNMMPAEEGYQQMPVYESYGMANPQADQYGAQSLNTESYSSLAHDPHQILM